LRVLPRAEDALAQNGTTVATNGGAAPIPFVDPSGFPYDIARELPTTTEAIRKPADRGWSPARRNLSKRMDWVGFASGALVGVIGSAAAVYFAHRVESGKDLAERRHRIYMLLLELYHKHFWISTNDMHGTQIKREFKQEFQELKFKIMDELRGADRLKQLPNIVDVVLSLRFNTETDRAVRLRGVIDDLAKDVNPRFIAATKKNDQELMKLMGADTQEYWRRLRKIDPWLSGDYHDPEAMADDGDFEPPDNDAAHDEKNPLP
jgi:hypothetical protein